ncbi:MAG: hypothetical protein AB7V50_07720 [Vampirovibrionia bacterium]
MKTAKSSSTTKRTNNKRKRLKINYFKLFRAFLLLFMFVAIISSIIANTFVVCKEISLEKLHTETQAVYMDNIENKLDVEYSKNLYNVYSKATNINNLHKPDKIIEVQCNDDDFNINIVQLPEDDNLRLIGGY